MAKMPTIGTQRSTTDLDSCFGLVLGQNRVKSPKRAEQVQILSSRLVVYRRSMTCENIKLLHRCWLRSGKQSGKLKTMTTDAKRGGRGKTHDEIRPYQLADGRWQAKKRLNGRRITATAATKAEAHKQLILKLESGQLPQRHTKPSDTIDALLDAHLADLSSGDFPIAPGTIDTYQTALSHDAATVLQIGWHPTRFAHHGKNCRVSQIANY